MSRTVRPHLHSPADRRDPEDRAKLSRIKKLVAEERARPPEAPTVDAAGIPIRARAYGPGVFYPASAEDLRAVIARLPPGTATGLAEIELCLDESPDQRAEGKPDPFVGFLSYELGPGVFATTTQGQYAPHLSKIQLFGFAYDPSRPDRAVLEIYLRLRMLSTFVHELAHHADMMTRGGRRQWRTQTVEERESFADAMTYVWTQDYVVPYLRETYPTEVTELTRWLEEHAGSALSLAFFAGEQLPDSPADMDTIFMVLLGAVAKGMEPPASHVMFADALGVCGHHEVAREILERVLRDHPGHPKAAALLSAMKGPSASAADPAAATHAHAHESEGTAIAPPITDKAD